MANLLDAAINEGMPELVIETQRFDAVTAPDFRGPPLTSSNPARIPASSSTLTPDGKGWWQIPLTGCALWFLLIRELRVEWSVNPQYSYGWSVPFLMIYLLWGRWRTRPAARPALWPAAPAAIAGILVLLLLPVRVIQEANPEWRLVSWVLALQVAGISLAAVWFAAGSRSARYFAAPILFFLVAVPWPMPLENHIVQSLMRITASCTTEALRGCGIEAMQRGNLIQLACGGVGIDEACSGVRSLQATLMLSLFLGEFYRFGWRARVLMVASGGCVAFLANLGRVFSLAWLAQRNGLETMKHWHDPAGVAVLGIFLVCLWLVARCLGVRSNAGEEKHPPAADSTPRARRIPGAVLAALAGWILVAEIGTEIWYRMHEGGARPQTAWSVSWPISNPSFKEAPIDETTRAMLRYNDGRSGSWTGADGSRWQMFLMRWLPGRNAAQLAKGHNPHICLPASGMILDADLGMRGITVNGISLPFHAYVFNDGRTRPLHVFHCLWEAQSLDETGLLEDGSPTSRLLAAWHGRRHLGQQMLQFAVRGYPTAEAAQTALAAVLRDEFQLAAANEIP